MSFWNSTQYKAIESVTEKRKNVFITGPVGVGKSEVIKNIVKFFKHEKKKIAITSCTEQSASKINGHYIYQYMHLIPDRLKLPKKMIIDEIKSYQKINTIYKSLEVLIIDQIQYLEVEIFDLISDLLKTVRGNDECFGGVQIILVGDFFNSEKKEKYIFQSLNFWNVVDEVHYLKNVYTQKDNDFLMFLKKARCNEITIEDIENLNEKCYYMKTELYDDKIKPTIFLNEKNEKVHELNENQLKKLNTKNYEFPFIELKKNISMNKLKNILNPVRNLKIGSQVMLNQNIDVEKGLIMGSRGVVIDILEPFNQEKNTNFEELKCKWIFPEECYIPIVEFKNGVKLKIPYFKESVEDAACWRLGINYGWYTNIELSENMTIDAIKVNFNQFKHPYVILNRIQSFESLILENVIEKNIFEIDTAILNFYDIPFHLQKMLSNESVEFASEKEILHYFEKK